MPYGEHLTRCRNCGDRFICGDCIKPLCDKCECKEHGHMEIAGFCARCGIKVKEQPTGRCLHNNFAADVNVNRIQNQDGVVTRFNADVRIECADCGCEFRFLGLPTGLNMDGAAVDVPGTTARLAVAPKGESLPPLEGPKGFSIRKS